MNGRRASLGKFTINTLFDMALAEYKRITGKDATKQDLIAEINLLIEKIKAVQSLSKDLLDFLVDFFKQAKRGFMGLNFNPSDRDILKAIDTIKKIVALGSTSKEDIERFNFWADMLIAFIDSRRAGSRSSYR